jgi:hypothetical protein
VLHRRPFPSTPSDDDHAHLALARIRIPASAIFGEMIDSKEPNPVAALFQAMGLTPQALADHFNLPLADVATALDHMPSGPVAAMLKLLGWDYFKLQMRWAPPWRLTIDNAAFDQVWKDNEWRRAFGLCWFPRVNHQVRELLAKLRADGNSNPQLVTALNASFIPTIDGTGDWTLSKVAHLFEADRKHVPSLREIPLSEYERGDEFRRHVVAMLQVKFAPQDPQAWITYRLEPNYEDGDRVTLAPAAGAPRMPRILADVFRQWIQRARWFDDRKTGQSQWRWEWDLSTAG